MVEEVQHLKETVIEIFNQPQFKLHKWHSNIDKLEVSDPTSGTSDTDQSYAKQQLGVRSQETKLLEVPWNKTTDKIGVTFPCTSTEVVTKRTVLSEIASIYDLLGLVLPVGVSGKMIYCDTCDNNIPWDKELPQDLKNSWDNWRRRLPRKIEVPRCLVLYREAIQAIDLHPFGDASGEGTCAAVYAVIQQNQGTVQGLFASKSRLAKKGLTIPRLELVSGLMATKLLDNIKAVLDGLPIRHCYSWLDSMVALYWISGWESYKQFVANLIQEKSYITWKHVRTKENPADIGSRGCQEDQLSTKWLEGSEWLSNPDDWPNEVTVEAIEETEAEAKQKSGEILKAVTQIEDEFNKLLSKYSFWKTTRITA